MKTPAGGKSRGRKPAGSKSSAGAAGKKRGMGVAQLEQYLRSEEMKKSLTRTTTQRPAELVHGGNSQSAVAMAFSGSTSCGLWGWDTGFMLQRLGDNNGTGFYGTGSSGPGLVDRSWVGGGPPYSRGGALELSSIPKFTQAVPPTDHCESCNKKRFTSLISRKLFENDSGNYYCNEAFNSADRFSFHSPHSNNLVGSSVELLGSSSVVGSEKRKEFEFFPAGKNGRSCTGSKMLGFASSELGIGTSYSAADAADDSNLVDLSLKLSY